MFNDILPTFGITVKFVDETDPQNFVKAADDKTRAFFCETVSNPACVVVELDKVADAAHSVGVPLVVDSTFTTPYLSQPISYGADVVCHSLTKWIGGHGTGVGGMVVDAGKFNWGAGKHPLYSNPDTSYGGLRWGIDLPEGLLPLAFILRMRTVPLRNLGACLSPDNAWMFLQGLETLPLRIEKHCSNALEVAKFLKAHPAVEWVKYPGLESDPMYARQQKYIKGKGGSMVIMGLKGGKEAGQKLIEALTCFSHVANVGDAKSLAIHPASTTHSQLSAEAQVAAGCPPEMVRLSVGIEDPADLVADLEHALKEAMDPEAPLKGNSLTVHDGKVAGRPAAHATLCLHAGYGPDGTTSRGVPIYRTSPFVFKSTQHAANLFALSELGNIYTRLGNPTCAVLEQRVAMLEGAHPLAGLAVTSGTSAVFYAIINIASVGDNIVSGRNLYGGTYTMFNDILPTFGITVKFVDETDPQNFVKAADDKTRAFFCETVSNPACVVVELDKVADAAHSVGVPLVVDSTFTTPYLSQPISYGADVVCHSLTKWIGGHGTGVGGMVVDAGKFNWGAGKHPLYSNPDTSYGGLRWGIDLPEGLLPLAFILRMRTVPLRNLGACLSPDNAWMFLQGLETLPLRIEKHCSNALEVAKFLKAHPAVEWVKYPGLESDPMYARQQKYIKGKGGSMVIMGLKGGKEAGQKLIEALTCFSHVANVGDAKSLAIHPASTTHSQLSAEAQVAAGCPPEMVRLSVGIEDPADLVADLEHAIGVATAPPAAKKSMTKVDMQEFVSKHGLEAKIAKAVEAALRADSGDPMADIVASLQEA